MNYTKISKLAVCTLLVIATGFSSCKKYINLSPEDATYDQVFWQTGANVEKAVSGAYGLLRDALKDSRSHFIFGDFTTDEFVRGSDYWNYADLSFDGRNHFSYAPYLEGSVWDWTRFYGLINQCHLIVENTPKIADAKFGGGKEAKNQLLGEGHFLRAYAYFYMTRVWGDPVLTKESLKDPLNIQPQARSTETEVLDYCIEDLLKAADLMGLNHERIRADKGAAWALLAHVYAWKHDYANAKKYCDKVITEGGYSLEPIDNYGDIWKGSSNESIFELFMQYDQVSNEASSGFFNAFLYEPIVKKGINTAWAVNNDYSNPLFGTGQDDRPGKIFTAGQGTNKLMLIKYANINYYDPNRPNTYVVDNNLVLLRLADIHLLKAEASVKLNDESTARDEVNIIRQRANASLLLPADVCNMDTVLNERRKELYGEGCIFYDNIRMILTNPDYANQLPDPYSAERVAKKGYYWPLSMRSLLPQDQLLTQNEWWKNH
ncbi:RagB/SusD family nutrient uptake outer membrane protein [Terrimonas pollutisoli]|uniref:RagB/SusD family nutrient uptake outer membrane protein n=1 Tax=Terrimonas pollutisoli TaxID=3034147 RepID=UPI0023EA8B6C|nr:RagB/SusD family nutrient uptake outer membrane protein [Terrimonas sp. H1YJ31]